jgi:hypothetical protein
MFDSKEKNFGNVKLGTTLFHTFKYLGDKGIRSVSSGCGCITETKHGNDISVSFQPKLPFNKTSHLVIKTLTVVFNDLTSEVLTLKAKVYVRMP